MQAHARGRKLLGRLENPVRKLRNVGDSVDCFLILNPSGRDDRDRAQTLRTQTRRGANQYQVCAYRESLLPARPRRAPIAGARRRKHSAARSAVSFASSALNISRSRSRSISPARRLATPSTKMVGAAPTHACSAPLRQSSSTELHEAVVLASLGLDPARQARRGCARSTSRENSRSGIAQQSPVQPVDRSWSSMSTRSCTAPALVTTTASTRPATQDGKNECAPASGLPGRRPGQRQLRWK